MDASQWALVLSVLTILATILVGILAWKANDKANTLTKNGIKIAARLEVIENQRHAWETEDRERDEFARAKASAISQLASFRVEWIQDHIVIMNIGNYTARDVQWRVRSVKGLDFGVRGEPTQSPRINPGDAHRYHYPRSMGMGDMLMSMSWQDGRNVRTVIEEQELPWENATHFSA